MISIKTKEEIQIIREGGKILAKIMKELEKEVRPGITTKELDRAAEALIFKHGAKPSFKNYKGFPACLCTSINEEIVHCLPSERKLKEGDIISLDLGVQYKSFHTDMAVTVPVGQISPETQKLIKATKEALNIGLKEIKPRNTFGDIGNAIQKYVENQAYSALGANGPIRGFNVVRELCGHGIGKKIHEDPQIPNFGKRGTGPELDEGMVFCIEPMVTVGDCRPGGRASLLAGRIKKAKDGYGYQTKDGSLSCHFEQTISVTKNGYLILTEFL